MMLKCDVVGGKQGNSVEGRKQTLIDVHTPKKRVLFLKKMFGLTMTTRKSHVIASGNKFWFT
jgi:hypothetical protein